MVRPTIIDGEPMFVTADCRYGRFDVELKWDKVVKILGPDCWY